jgi:hypothetical protein
MTAGGVDLAHRLNCAHCHRQTATLVSGMLVWKSVHDGKSHANAITLASLFSVYLEHANPQALKDLQYRITQKLDREEKSA